MRKPAKPKLLRSTKQDEYFVDLLVSGKWNSQEAYYQAYDEFASAQRVGEHVNSPAIRMLLDKHTAVIPPWVAKERFVENLWREVNCDPSDAYDHKTGRSKPPWELPAGLRQRIEICVQDPRKGWVYKFHPALPTKKLLAELMGWKHDDNEQQQMSVLEAIKQALEANPSLEFNGPQDSSNDFDN